MTRNHLTRRALLRTLGVGAGALPLLDVSRSFGQARVYPKRLVVVVWTNGTVPSAFWPTGNGNTLSGLTFPSITQSLAPHAADLTFMRGLETKNFTDLDVGAFGHQTYATTFTGTRGRLVLGGGEPRSLAVSSSIDQVIADGIGLTTNLPVRSLNLGVLRGGNQDHNCCVYRGDGAPVAPESDPAAAASKLFTGMPGPEILRVRAERQSMLDFVGKRLAGFGQNLGTEDRQKIAAHLDSVRELEKQLVALGNTNCEGPALGALPQEVPNYPALLNAHMDIITAGMRCDLTRVATLQLGDYNGDGIIFSWAGFNGQAVGTDFGGNKLRDWHDVAHTPRDPNNPDNSNTDHKVKLDAWVVEQFAALIQRFKDVPEGDGTMLDNTAILFANHMTDGSRHNWDDLPWIMAGNLGGALSRGRLVQAPAGTPSAHLFSALAKAMDVELPGGSFGDPEYGGTLAGVLA